MMPPRERLRLLLRGLAKLAIVVLVAGGVGAGLGIGIAKLSGDDEPDVAGTSTITASGEPKTSEATTSAPGTPTATTSTTRTTPQTSGEPLRVTIRSAVLHPAATPSGERRQRARLGVRVEVQNRGAERLVLPRPSLLAANQRIATDAAADGPGTSLGAIDAGETASATLRFETVGAVTQQLTTQRRARVIVAGRSRPITVTVGTPVARADSAAP